MLVATSASEAFEHLATAEVEALPFKSCLAGLRRTGPGATTTLVHSAVARRAQSDFNRSPSVADAVIHDAVFKILTKRRNAEVRLSARGDAFDNVMLKRAAWRYVEVP